MSSGRKRLLAEAERVNPVIPVHVWRSPAGASTEILIVAHLNVYSTIHEHCISALPNETGGFLLGHVGFDSDENCWHVEVDEAVSLELSEQTPAYLSFTWRDVNRIRTYREDRFKALVGWYHTHPDMGIFLSDTDLDKTHRILFAEPFQIALVYDPVRRSAGYFFWEGPQKIDAAQADWREFRIAVDERESDDAETGKRGGLEDTNPGPHREVASDEGDKNGQELDSTTHTDSEPAKLASEEESPPVTPEPMTSPGKETSYKLFFLGLVAGIIAIVLVGLLILAGYFILVRPAGG